MPDKPKVIFSVHQLGPKGEMFEEWEWTFLLEGYASPTSRAAAIEHMQPLVRAFESMGFDVEVPNT